MPQELPTYTDIPGFEEFVERFGRFDPTTGKIEIVLGLLISEALRFLFVFAGLGLLLYLLYGGFQLMTSGGDPKGIAEGKGKITNAIAGFLIIFVAFWVVQAVAIIFGLKELQSIFGR